MTRKKTRRQLAIKADYVSLDHVQTTKAAVTFYYRGCHSRVAHFVRKFIRPYDFQMGEDRRFYAAKMDGYIPENIWSKPVRRELGSVNFLSNVLLFISARFIRSSLFYRPLITVVKNGDM